MVCYNKSMLVQKIKNFFFSFKRLNKKSAIFLLLISVVFGLTLFILPTNIAYAGWDFWNDIIDFFKNFGESILSGMIGVIMTVLIAVSQLLVILPTLLLNWVLSPHFISVSFTHNDFVLQGWQIVRDFVNMGFIIALVFIALSTALRIREFEAKKTLPVLLIIALLINFSPVICGVIIDASNIVMNHFLKGVVGEDSIWENLGEQYTKLWEEGWSEDPAKMLAKGFAIVMFNLVSSIVFLIFAFLFMARYVILWLLVILSPLAFFCRILPLTKRIWSMWWNQFIQWCFIGVVAAFFLYLAQLLLSKNIVSEGPSSEEIEGISALFTYMVPMVVLIVGVFASFSISAMGAGYVRKAAMGAGKWAGRMSGGAVRRIPAVSRAEEAARRKLERVPVLGRAIGGPGAYEAGRKAKMETATKAIEKIPDTPQGNKDILKRISQPALTEKDRYARAAAIEVLAKRKDLTDKAVKFIPEAQKLEANAKTIYQARPDFAPHLTTIDSVTKKPRAMTTEEVMGKIEPAEFYRNIQKEALGNSDVVFYAALDERKFNQMTRHMKVEQKREFKNTFFSAPAPPRPLTKKEQAIMKRRIKDLSTSPEWQV